jgi:NSS family neurotransmitter:Na+ symporter
MPLGALLMSVMIGWEIQPKSMLDEIHSGYGTGIDGFFSLCMKVIVPLGMLLVLSGQIASFFGSGAAGYGYIIGIIVLVIALVAAFTSPKRKALR